MAEDGLGLGAGLSGFAQGFAASFRDRKEREYEQKLEERKNAREFFIKGALDPTNPSDPSDPAIARQAEDLFGKEHAPLFMSLLKKSNDHIYAVKAEKAHAAAQPLEPGEKRTISDKTAGISETRQGPALAKPGKTPEQIKEETTAREQAKEPFRQAKEDRAARRQRVQAVQAERRQFRQDVRKTAMKLRSDPTTRPFYKRLMDWVSGTNPDQRLSDALSGIPAEALPPSLQQQQSTSQTPQAPAAPQGGVTQSGRVKWTPVTPAQ